MEKDNCLERTITMSEIEMVEWQNFEIQSIFDVIRGNAKDVTKREMTGEVALVTATDKNNAFYDFVTPKSNETIYKNTITIHNNGNGVGLAFYHEYKFIATSDVTILIDKTNRINKEMAEFIISMLQQQKEKYCYGYKLSNQRLKKQKILLPIKKDGTIHYQFMNKYIKTIRENILRKYEENIQREKEYLKKLRINNSKEIKWKEFMIEDLFEVKSGKCIDGNIGDKSKGNYAYITRKKIDNGLDGFIDYDDEFLNKQYPVITIGNETAKPYVQVFPFYTGTKVNILKPKQCMNKYVLFFICQSLKMNKEKYSYSFTINSTRLKKQNILLPVNKNNEIDYAYMENYIKEITLNKLNDYIKYRKE